MRPPLDVTTLRAVRDAVRKHGGPGGLALKVVDVWRAYGTSGIAARVATQYRRSTARGGRGAAAGVILPSLAEDAPFEPTRADLALRPDGTVGVMAHVFYPELADELARYLSHIPWPFTLLVSTAAEEHRRELERTFARLRRVSRLDVRVVPNRGRDIAPFLVAFGREVRALDYVCHVHTKKSLRTGADQSAWRRHLLDTLLGSEERVRAVFAQLRADPGVGLVYPSPGAFVPYWAHTWLGARAAGEALLARMGLPGRENGYLDVVAGSMMWARVAALAPLLDLGLTLEEFPPEEGQLDGTLQHAIERSFTLVARATGYSARVLAETRDRHVFEVTNRKNIDDYLRAAPVAERIAAAAADAEVVSFDVFDTLLVRPFGVPDSVFRLLEDRIARADGVPGFMARRKHAEEEVRLAKAGCGDATLREIYTALARREGVSGEVAARWMRSELDAERDLLRPRPAVVSAMEALRAAGKRIVLVSDMYLEERDLRALLDASGVRAYDAVYVSSETGLRKDSGAIWPELLRRERVAPGRLVHVGDNERSDVQLVGDLGVGRPVHVLRPLDGFELLPEGRALAGGARPTRWQDDLALGLVANRCVLHLDADPTASLEGRLLADPERFGYCVLGPATLGFVGWLARTAANDGVQTLEFVSREGWLLKGAFDEVASHPRLRRPLPKSRYFLCSRRAAVVAALRTPDDLRLLLGGTFAGTLRELLAHRIGVEDVGAYEARLGDAALGRRVELPRGASKAFACLSDAADLVLAHAAVERAGYLDYARRLTESRAALVDVGFSGTAQSALMRLVGAPLTGYYWVTTDRVAALERAGGRTRAWLAERVDPAASDMPALRYHMLLEAVFTAPQGQLLRFEGGAGTPRPVFKPPGAAQRRFAEIARIHAGVLAYVRDALDALGDDALDLDLDRELVQRPLRLVAEGRWPVGPLSELLFVDDEYSGLAEVSAVGRIRSLAGRAPSDPAARRA